MRRKFEVDIGLVVEADSERDAWNLADMVIHQATATELAPIKKGKDALNTVVTSADIMCVEDAYEESDDLDEASKVDELD